MSFRMSFDDVSLLRVETSSAFEFLPLVHLLFAGSRFAGLRIDSHNTRCTTSVALWTTSFITAIGTMSSSRVKWKKNAGQE